MASHSHKHLPSPSPDAIVQYKKYYWSEAAGFRLLGYADGTTYKSRDTAMTACLTNSKCHG